LQPLRWVEICIHISKQTKYKDQGYCLLGYLNMQSGTQVSVSSRKQLPPFWRQKTQISPQKTVCNVGKKGLRLAIRANQWEQHVKGEWKHEWTNGNHMWSGTILSLMKIGEIICIHHCQDVKTLNLKEITEVQFPCNKDITQIYFHIKNTFYCHNSNYL